MNYKKKMETLIHKKNFCSSFCEYKSTTQDEFFVECYYSKHQMDKIFTLIQDKKAVV